MNCEKCDRQLNAAITRYDGPVVKTMGYNLCACDRPIQTDCGTVYPGDEEHDRLLQTGNYSINDVLKPER